MAVAFRRGPRAPRRGVRRPREDDAVGTGIGRTCVSVGREGRSRVGGSFGARVRGDVAREMEMGRKGRRRDLVGARVLVTWWEVLARVCWRPGAGPATRREFFFLLSLFFLLN